MTAYVRILKEADDPICSRISMGGKEEIGYYVVYRGDIEEIKKVFEICHAAIKKLDGKP